jgi:hypothetical protein
VDGARVPIAWCTFSGLASLEDEQKQQYRIHSWRVGGGILVD